MTNVGAPTIHAIDRRSVHRICAGQVITDLRGCVKELVENALDAGASSVEVRFATSAGSDGFERLVVVDNGSGIPPHSHENVCAKHFTSKIADFADVATVTSFGFRGEALAALSAVAGGLNIATSWDDSGIGANLQFDALGILLSSQSAPRERGTTVTVENLFANLPVRLREFKKHYKRELNKCIELIHAFALIATGVRILASNQIGKGTRNVLVSTSANGSLKLNFSNVFGSRLLSSIQEVDLSVSATTLSAEASTASRDSAGPSSQYSIEDEEMDAEVSQNSNPNSAVTIQGLISKPTFNCGRTSADRQFFYINKRPCDLPKVAKVINEVYKSYNSYQYPILVWNLIMDPDAYDVNVTPDKRTLLLHNEKIILENIKVQLESLFTPDRSFVVSRFSSQPVFREAAVLPMEVDTVPPQHVRHSLHTEDGCCERKRDTTGDPDENSEEDGNKRVKTGQNTGHRAQSSAPSTSDINGIINVAVERPHADQSQQLPDQESPVSAPAENVDSISEPLSRVPLGLQLPPQLEVPSRAQPPKTQITLPPSSNEQQNRLQVVRTQPSPLMKHRRLLPHEQLPKRSTIILQSEQHSFLNPKLSEPNLPSPSSAASQQRVIQPKRPPLKPSSPSTAIPQIDTTRLIESIRIPSKIETSTTSIASLFHSRVAQKYTNKTTSSATATSRFTAGIERTCEAQAVQELSRNISKRDFLTMRIIGQFNLGFIVVELKGDLFVVDQHASDEKFNYETFTKAYKFTSQRLISPMPLDLPAQTELLALEHADVLKRNGFEIRAVDPRRTGARVELVAIPQSKITFGVADLEDLLHRIGECSTSGALDRVRCGRVLSLLASKACRGSVMIGDSLDYGAMLKIVRNLSDLDHPWNCPHGRPTMRHLLDLKDKR
ncbi:hypothetical protein BC830DRAFT_1148067 [Chytriomyces sp. MP71]|nr:hypothetical protein BC830DRAFT_1148067 [Chytriomyces sp. MP71]